MSHYQDLQNMNTLILSNILYMTDIIEKYYIKNKYPNLDRLYNYLKDDDIKVTKKQVKEFLDAQALKQVTQHRRVYKSDQGHITA